MINEINEQENTSLCGIILNSLCCKNVFNQQDGSINDTPESLQEAEITQEIFVPSQDIDIENHDVLESRSDVSNDSDTIITGNYNVEEAFKNYNETESFPENCKCTYYNKKLNTNLHNVNENPSVVEKYPVSSSVNERGNCENNYQTIQESKDVTYKSEEMQGATSKYISKELVTLPNATEESNSLSKKLQESRNYNLNACTIRKALEINVRRFIKEEPALHSCKTLYNSLLIPNNVSDLYDKFIQMWQSKFKSYLDHNDYTVIFKENKTSFNKLEHHNKYEESISFEFKSIFSPITTIGICTIHFSFLDGNLYNSLDGKFIQYKSSCYNSLIVDYVFYHNEKKSIRDSMKVDDNYDDIKSIYDNFRSYLEATSTINGLPEHDM